MSGWFAMRRGTLDHEIFAPTGKWSKFEAWVWMVETAPYKDGHATIKGKRYQVKRGHVYHSIRFMSGKFRWSEKAVRVFIDALVKHGAVEKIGAQKGAHFGAQLRLCNYDKYQNVGRTKGRTQGHKEEQINNIPVGKADESASAVVEIDSVKSTVWRVGKAYLAKHGVKNSGAVIGRWLRDATPANLLDAIDAAQRAETQDPVPYITASLKPKASDEAWRKWL